MHRRTVEAGARPPLSVQVARLQVVLSAGALVTKSTEIADMEAGTPMAAQVPRSPDEDSRSVIGLFLFPSALDMATTDITSTALRTMVVDQGVQCSMPWSGRPSGQRRTRPLLSIMRRHRFTSWEMPIRCRP